MLKDILKDPNKCTPIFMTGKTKHYKETNFCQIIYTYNVIINTLTKLGCEVLRWTGGLKQNAKKLLKKKCIRSKVPYHFLQHLKLQ